MQIFQGADRDDRLANSAYFTGRVWQEPIISADDPARVTALRVTFEPAARTAWHTHPLGQTLYVLSGTGLVGLRGQAPRVIRAGDTVWFPPGEEHWHGAGPNTMLCHLAIQESLEGTAADWLEKVCDADYARPPAVS